MEVSLLSMKNGKRGKIVRLDGGIEFRKRMESLNIREGKIIKKITKQPLRGPVVIEIDNTRLAIGMRMAMRIFVEVK